MTEFIFTILGAVLAGIVGLITNWIIFSINKKRKLLIHFKLIKEIFSFFDELDNRGLQEISENQNNKTKQIINYFSNSQYSARVFLTQDPLFRMRVESKEDKLIFDSFDIENKLIFYLEQIVKFYKIKILEQYSNEIEIILFEIQNTFDFDNLLKKRIFFRVLKDIKLWINTKNEIKKLINSKNNLKIFTVNDIN